MKEHPIMDRHAADYDQYHGPDAHEAAASKPRLTPSQTAVLCKAGQTRGLFTVTEAAELRALAGLVKKGLVEVTLSLTAEGLVEANDLLADTPADLMSDEDYLEALEKEVKDATEALARAERDSEEADARCLYTPMGAGNGNAGLRDASSRGMDRVENAKERLEQAKRELEEFGKR